jgi:hypothetical protein
MNELLWRVVGEFSGDLAAVACWARADHVPPTHLLMDRDGGRGAGSGGGAERGAAEQQADGLIASVDLLRAEALVKERLELHEAQRRADRQSCEGERLRAAVEAAPGGTPRRAMALRELALFVALDEGRPWKGVDPLLEAWSILQKDESESGLVREAEFLDHAAPILVSARKLDYAVAMASRRASILRIVDPAAANAASVWAQELRNRAEQGGSLQKRILSLKVERELDVPVLQPPPPPFTLMQSERQQQPLQAPLSPPKRKDQQVQGPPPPPPPPQQQQQQY